MIVSVAVKPVAVAGCDFEYESFAFKELEVAVDRCKADRGNLFFYTEINFFSGWVIVPSRQILQHGISLVTVSKRCHKITAFQIVFVALNSNDNHYH